jgi:hypothetical protein
VEGKRLGIELEDMLEAIEKHWKRLRVRGEGKRESGGREG